MWNIIQEEATREQYIFNFILVNIIFIISFLNRNKPKTNVLTWGLLVLFVIYAFWDTDYFSMEYIFYYDLGRDFRDPLYYFISLVSFNSYTIFRLIVWGSALFMFYKTIKKFNLTPNYSSFVFAIFFLLTFSYGRVSLGMSLYFYGVSCLLMRKDNSLWTLLKGAIFVLCSYWGHRSMIVPILFTPLILFKLNKKTVALLATVACAFFILIPILLVRFANENFDMGEDLSAVQDAAESFSALTDVQEEYNWKFQLVTILRNYSFYLLLLYLIWLSVFSKYKNNISLVAKRLITLCCGICLLALAFFSVSGTGSNILGYRYLYMLGIPLCLLMSYVVERGYCKHKTAILLLAPAFIYTEGFLIGKILSF